jgi:hypothetical protein
MIDFIKKYLIGPLAFLAGYIFFYLEEKSADQARQKLADSLLDAKDAAERQRGVANEASKNWEEHRGKYHYTGNDTHSDT